MICSVGRVKFYYISLHMRTKVGKNEKLEHISAIRNERVRKNGRESQDP